MGSEQSTEEHHTSSSSSSASPATQHQQAKQKTFAERYFPIQASGTYDFSRGWCPSLGVWQYDQGKCHLVQGNVNVWGDNHKDGLSFQLKTRKGSIVVEDPIFWYPHYTDEELGGREPGDHECVLTGWLCELGPDNRTPKLSFLIYNGDDRKELLRYNMAARNQWHEKEVSVYSQVEAYDHFHYSYYTDFPDEFRCVYRGDGVVDIYTIDKTGKQGTEFLCRVTNKGVGQVPLEVAYIVALMPSVRHCNTFTSKGYAPFGDQKPQTRYGRY